MGERCGTLCKAFSWYQYAFGLDSGLNKVEVAKKQAQIKAHDFVFQVQKDHCDDKLELGQP